MQYADSAAVRLDVRLEPLPRAQTAGWLWILVTTLLGWASDVTSKEVVITRIATGEEMARAQIRDGILYLVDDAKRDLRRHNEAGWLAKWGDPASWHA